MKEEITNFERMDLFNQYNNEDNPFLIITTKIDITNIYNNYKKYYPTIGYIITLAANKIDNFKLRYEDNKIYKYNKLNPNFTDMFNNHNIGYFTIPLKDNYKEHMDTYNEMKTKFLETNKSYINNTQDEIWLSCVPWYTATSITPPFDKKVTIPQFIWDKFDIQDNKCFINLTIMAHHGFVDGYHIGLFIKELTNIIENINTIEEFK